MSDSRTRVDETIDRAVRDIMRRDPTPGFRSRVLSRLDSRSRRTALWPALATAAGVLAVAAIAIVTLRDAPLDPPGEPPPVVAGQPAQPRPAPVASRPLPEVSAPATEVPARRPPRAEPIRTATFGPRDGLVSAANLAPPRAESANVAAPAPIVETEPPLASTPVIEVHPLMSPAPIEIAPIVVPPLRIPRMPQTLPSPPR